MPFAHGGAPTPSENWDDDFDFQPPSPPARSSSAVTSKSRRKLDVFGSSDLKPSAVERQKSPPKGKAVESWDDDFEYDPLDWTKDAESKNGNTGQMATPPTEDLGRALPLGTQNIDRIQPPATSRPIPQRSSSTLLSATSTTRSDQNSAQNEPTSSSSLTNPAPQSDRRDRKRSSDRLASPNSSPRINVNTTSVIARASLSDRTDLPARLPKSTQNKEGVFMRRISSVRRRISSSISMGPSSINNIMTPDTPLPVDQTPRQSSFQPISRKPERHSRAATSIDMPPPPVPISALRTSSLMNVAVRKEGNSTYVSSESALNSPEGMPFRVKTRINQDREHGDPFSGLPRATPTSVRMDRNVSAASSQDVETSSVLPSPVLVTPTQSAEMLSRSNTGIYGFHLPSPSAGSAYKMFNAAPDRRTSIRQTSESSSRSDAKYTEPMLHGRNRTQDSSDVQRTPRASRYHARPAQTAIEDCRLPAFSGDLSKLSIDDQDMRSRSASGTTVESSVGVSTDQHDSPTYINRITSRESTVEVPQSRAGLAARNAAPTASASRSGKPISSREETALDSFRFGNSTSKTASRLSSDRDVRQYPATLETITSASNADRPLASRKDRARLSLQRISSLSQRHSRKISDSWKNISGSAVGERSGMKQSQVSEPGTPVEGRTMADITIRDSRLRYSMVTVNDVMTSSQPPQDISSKDDTLGTRKSAQSGATLPLPGALHDTIFVASVPQQSQVIGAAMRSLSHNDSPTASRFKTLGTEEVGVEKVESERGLVRRSSLGDLKIPSRVVSAQRGLKEEIGAMKQFAAGIQDLKALMAQHTILRVKQKRSGFNDADLELRYASWWSLADLLVQLGETGSLSSTKGRPAMDDEDAEVKARNQRQRRITLAPGTVLPSAHLSALSMNSESLSLLGGREGPPVTDMGGSLASIPNPTMGHTSQRSLSNIWRASTGRIDFSSAQLEELRGILEKPQLPATSAALPISDSNARPIVTSRNKVNDGRKALGATASPTKTLPHQRRASKSNVTVFKDFWRAASGSQRSGGSVNLPAPVSGTGRPALPKSQTRPSLASIFRRSSSKVPTVPVATPSRFSLDRKGNQQEEHSVSSASILSENCASPESSLSDWDSPSQVDDLMLSPPPVGSSVTAQHRSNNPSLRPDAELTITRSDSRKLLADLGRGPSPAAETKSVSLQAKATVFPADLLVSAAPFQEDDSMIDHKSNLPVLLTPASLPPLLAKLNDVTRNCKTHLEVISERLAHVDTRVTS
ncbi:hypothetical protein QFC22_004325 [Naganishia vaughanmartiniae]|uniref:Uncharacterized protein n=1 Tax=Naganishia vaughanmartiniae TaxID=1424756 RepID=A0ACC2X0B0_9TREE|nr:hypothetical protein QFC22_004325 [Naganishia vaughanmartiniae]